MLKVPVRKVIVVGVGVVQKAALFNHELARVDVGLALRPPRSQCRAKARGYCCDRQGGGPRRQRVRSTW